MPTRIQTDSIHPSRCAGRFRLAFSVDPEGGSVLSGNCGPHQDRTQGSELLVLRMYAVMGFGF
jgi:hypothetical protein